MRRHARANLSFPKRCLQKKLGLIKLGLFGRDHFNLRK